MPKKSEIGFLCCFYILIIEVCSKNLDRWFIYYLVIASKDGKMTKLCKDYGREPQFSMWQLCGVQVELTEKTTQLASHKESNFKLTQGIEEAIAKIQEKNTKVEDLELRIETEARVMNEQVDFFTFFADLLISNYLSFSLYLTHLTHILWLSVNLSTFLSLVVSLR